MKKQTATMAKSQKILLVALFSAIFLGLTYGTSQETSPEKIIVLSPHFDDAVLSLGGFMASQKNLASVVTFFASGPQKPLATRWDKMSGFRNSDEAISLRAKENTEALAIVGATESNLFYFDFQYREALKSLDTALIQTEIEKNILDMINQNSTGKIDIYGPAEFGPTITHPDHQILHDAFTVVARRNLARKNVRFFFYEDFPYVSRYETSTTTPLKTFMEKTDSGVPLRETPLSLPAISLGKKIKAVESYYSQGRAFSALGEKISADARNFTRNRCKKLGSSFKICEVVYELR